MIRLALVLILATPAFGAFAATNTCSVAGTAFKAARKRLARQDLRVQVD